MERSALTSPTANLLGGDVLAILRGFPEASVACCITSPPYFQLRDYDLPTTQWGDGWVGCLGLEESPEAYVRHIVEVFAEVARVLRSDGTCWLNLGDRFINKELLQLPAMVVQALVVDGWGLRSEIIWHYRRWSNAQRPRNSSKHRRPPRPPHSCEVSCCGETVVKQW